MLNDGDIAVVFAVNVLKIDFARHGIRFHLRDLLVAEDGFDIVNEINGYTTNYTLIVGENSIVYKEVNSTFGVNINNTITDYTITDDGWTITWTMSGVTYKFTNPTGYAYKLYVGTDDYTLTKQA